MKDKQKLSLFDITIIAIGLVVGMGIFRTAKDAAAASTSPAMYFGVWILGGLIAICGALTYAEIGSRYPVTGGYYKIFAVCYHPSLAFGINCIILISNAASLSGVALIGSEYIAPLIFESPTAFNEAMLAIAAIVIFYGVNLMGLRMSSNTQNVLMIIKLCLILVLIAALFFPQLYHVNTESIASATTAVSTNNILLFGVALKAVSFTYGGYQQTINFGEEVHNPQKNLPRGIVMGIITIITLYLCVNYSYYKIIGFEELKSTKSIAAIVAEKMFGAAGGYTISILLFLAVLAYVNVLLLSNPRVMYAMSMDGILPKAFKKKEEKKDVLTVSLSVFAGICVIVLFFADRFEQILSFTIFLDSIGMATSAGAIFILRKRTKHLDNTGIYKMRLYPVLPVIFILAYIFVGTVIAITNPEYAVTGISVLTVFIILYFIFRKKGNNNNNFSDADLLKEEI
ncbi:APC family permease [Parafilimonas terrae]|uniref:Basic amino acid/polyamine antiporter, APA family n=1 Tax=Parafilimonas terrae TaxID=1465490 RepID=A0A1I5U7F6_9BACT|nr:amino acid permease [Parafilimonas terrae]SFP91219.1 basic amino acid/polyamine antiporter, APA family [Parafilimonas terrae]